MKKYLFVVFFVGIAWTCWRCSKDTEKAELIPVLEIVTAPTATLPTAGGTEIVKFKTNVPWSAVINDVESKASSHWRIAPSQGSAGDVQVTVSVDPNVSYDNLSAEMVITAGNLREKVTFVQKKKDALVLTENLYPVPYEGQTIEVQLKSNVDYSVEIPVADQTWVSQVESKGVTTDVLYFKVEPYGNGAKERSTKIIFKDKASDLSDDITITQQPAPPILSLSPAKIEVPYAGQTIQLDLQRSMQCQVIIDPQAMLWIKPIESKAVVDEKLSFEVLPNEGYPLRDATIVVLDPVSKQTDTVKVHQRSKYVPTLTDCWDIYDGGGYRYGPSIIINDDGSIDAWFAAVGGTYGKNTFLYNTEGTNVAVGALNAPGTTVSQKFTANTPFWSITVTSPNWNNSPCGFTFNLYEWDNDLDYAQNVKQNPIATKVFVNYKDGEKLGVSNDAKFPAGTYVWELSKATTTHSGVWQRAGDVAQVISYKNGKIVEGQNWVAQYTEEKTSGYNFWDQASYQHSTNGGKNWSDEVMTLLPTEFSSDHFSVCDPGAAAWGGYYYIGYTSTENEAMVENHAYVARSRNPDGPWEKWSGTSWGNDPKPVIFYNGNPKNFGAGEPSIVVLDNTVYFYYSWCDATVVTRVATASADDPNWPGNLTYRGVAIDKSAIGGADHSDVKYREDIGKFQAIHTASRMSASSYLVLWQSDDGLKFEKIAELRDNLQPGLHNCGWSGDSKGHIKAGVQQYIAYAYGLTAWGVWHTRWAKATW